VDAVTYQPDPIDTDAADLPDGPAPLVERLAEHVHDTWAQRRMNDGWTYGPKRDNQEKTHPCLGQGHHARERLRAAGEHVRPAGFDAARVFLQQQVATLPDQERVARTRLGISGGLRERACLFPGQRVTGRVVAGGRARTAASGQAGDEENGETTERSRGDV
jgi:hypothetical protein